MKSHFRPLIATVFLGVAQFSAAAQTRSPWSVQGSGLYSGLGGGAYKRVDPGAGFEIQGRRTINSLWSLGCGVQGTFHSLAPVTGQPANGKDNVEGLFCEPRRLVDINSESVFPYVSARLAALRQSETSGTLSSSAIGTMMNIGTGVVMPLGGGAGNYPTLLELGVSGGYAWFGDATTSVAGGQTSKVSRGSGWDYVLRIGLAVGLPFGNPKR